jgi:hypothetical protein
LISGASFPSLDRVGTRGAGPVPSGAGQKEHDALIHENLRSVINRGVQLYNSGQIDACYRLFEGSLRTIRPFVAHKEGLVKEIDKVLDDVELNPVIWQRAFALRAVLDKIRKETRPAPKGKPKDDGKLPEKKEPKKVEDDKENDTLKQPREVPGEEKPSPEDDGVLKMPRLLEKGKG